MTTWNYRLVKTVEGIKGHMFNRYEIHEVYYNENGEPESMTENPIRPYEIEHACPIGPEEIVFSDDENKEQVVKQLEMMLADIKKHPVFEVPEEWLK